jgi:hypothetical protein
VKNFVSGVNLGGWLSQYAQFDHEHFQTFITEADIRRIASWGLDHVRLPVDYPLLESDDAPGVPNERGYAYIDACIEWCANAGLALVLDVHEAPGFTFRNDLEVETAARNVLFHDAATQARFVELWREIVRRYHRAPVPIIFELLNEVTLPENGLWNELIERTVAAIREISPDAVVMIGGTHNNAVSGLEGLIEIDDPNVVYTFHTYDPLLFTHQNAYWAAAPREWGGAPHYPGYLEGLGEFLDAHPEHNAEHRRYVDWHMDREMLAEILAPALEFAERTGHHLYCGEFGVADWVDPASRRAWLADFLGLLREHGIGFALWSYKAMDFGLVNASGEVVDPEYLEILRGADLGV